MMMKMSMLKLKNGSWVCSEIEIEIEMNLDMGVSKGSAFLSDEDKRRKKKQDESIRFVGVTTLPQILGVTSFCSLIFILSLLHS